MTTLITIFGIDISVASFVGGVGGAISFIYGPALIKKIQKSLTKNPFLEFEIIDRRPESGEWLLRVKNTGKGEAKEIDFSIDSNQLIVEKSSGTSLYPTLTRVKDSNGELEEYDNLKDYATGRSFQYYISILKPGKEINFKFKTLYQLNNPHADTDMDAYLDDIIQNRPFKLFWVCKGTNNAEHRWFKCYNRTEFKRV